MLTAERIHGRLIDIEVGEVPGIGWVAVGTVKQGLGHEAGMRFEARAGDATDGGPGAIPLPSLDAWLVTDARSELINGSSWK